MEPEDLDILYTIENMPEAWSISNATVPYSRYALRQFLEESRADVFADRQMRLLIECRTDGQVAGTIDLFDYQPLHARGEVGIAMRSEYRGRGYASEALRLLCRYLFSFLHLRQLTAHVAVENLPSMRLFSSCGFRECGCLRQWWRSGDRYQDVCLLQCFAEDFSF